MPLDRSDRTGLRFTTGQLTPQYEKFINRLLDEWIGKDTIIPLQGKK